MGPSTQTNEIQTDEIGPNQPMPRNYPLLFWNLAGTCLLMSLTGCTHSPAVSTSAPVVKPLPTKVVSNSASRFGSFNLHKRHGLGGWEGTARTSHPQWLQQIQDEQDAGNATKAASPRPGSTGISANRS